MLKNHFKARAELDEKSNEEERTVEKSDSETEGQIRRRDIGGGGCVPALSSHKVPLSSEPCTRQQWVWVTDGSQKNLRVRNGAFVSSAHIVVDKECTATGSVGGGYFESVVLQAATSHWKESVTGGEKTAKCYTD